MQKGLEGVNIALGEHRDKQVIWLRFPYDTKLIDEVKALGASWSNSAKAWHVPDNAHFRTMFDLPPLPPVGKEVLAKIHPVNQEALQRMQDLLTLKGYSPNTLRTYSLELAQLLYLLKDYPIDHLTPERLRSYILYCIKELKLTENQVHSRFNAIKFYFEQVLGRETFTMDIPRPKKPASLPKVLSKGEVRRLLAATDNPKHQLILQLCYGMGLRVSEIVQLKIEDIDTERLQVHIRSAKGKKDRYVNLPELVLDALQAYLKEFKPEEYLFEGQYGGQYSVRSAQAVFKNAMTKARIRKQVGIHSLRHSYATHLHEYGTDIALIKELLGHQQIKTTLIYTHVSNRSVSKVGSPLDKLDSE